MAVPLPLHRTFHYRIPEHLLPWVVPGVRCAVPLGRTRAAAVVVAVEDEAPVEAVKDLIDVLDPTPCLAPDLLALGAWMARYYHHPLGEALSAMIPPAFRASAEAVYRPLPGPGPSSAAAEGLLARLRARGEVPASAVAPREAKALAELVAAGRAAREWRVRRAPEPRGVEWFRLTAAAPEPAEVARRSPRQAEALRALAGGEAVAAQTLGVPRDALLRAVARGWVERGESAPEVGTPAAYGVGAPRQLTPPQAAAVAAAVERLDQGAFAPVLVEGVTGSGKTEVYLRVAAEAVGRGKGAVILVPEIALTPQMLGRFLAAFGSRVALLHSGLGERERRLHWERVRRGEAPLVLGARSAVFAPVPNLGLVVVDEEHDASYKQEEGLRYHGKHVALVRAQLAGAVALLGSATPDVETTWAVQTGRYARVLLPARAVAVRPPEIRLVDLRQEEARRRRRVLFSEPLRRAVADALGRGEQALLFLNRRGLSPAVVCSTCGDAVRCRACSVALTLHGGRSGGRLLCHYCGHREGVPAACPGCGGATLGPAGAGTQRLVDAAREEWPEARVLRLDRDTARGSGTEVLGAFHRGEADLLVGTQMVAKGHHFPRLTVVGVVDADMSLHFPDFRAAERTFQLLTQVAGRAGREERPGLALLQTRSPHEPALVAAAAGDYQGFAAAELRARREAGFPPFRRLALLRVSALDPGEAERAAQAAAQDAKRLGAPVGVQVLGPAPAPLERLRGRWRQQALLRAPGSEPGPLHAVIRALLAGPSGRPPGEVRLHVDLDPVNLL